MTNLYNPFSDLPEMPVSDMPPGDDPDVMATTDCLYSLVTVATIIIAIIICGLLGSCKVEEHIVTVPEIHDTHHWHSDTLRQKDSTYIERETIIQQADSATLARYGIQLQTAQQAWLIQTRELERQLQQLMQTVTERDTIRDSIPYAVPTPVEVPAQLTWWQQTRLHIANVVLCILVVAVIVFGVHKRIKSLGG